MKRTIFSSICTSHLDKSCVIVPDGPQVTYRQFRDEIERVSILLAKAGLAKGENVTVVLPAGVEFLILFYSITNIRCGINPLNPAYSLQEFKFFLSDIKPKVAIVLKSLESNHHFREAATELKIPLWEVSFDSQLHLHPNGASFPSVEPEYAEENDTALLLHTSGTTGTPKQVPLTHLNIYTSMTNIANTYQLSEKDTTIVVMPLFHVHGLVGATLSTITSGGTVVLPPRFSASTFWKHVQQYNVTWYTAVPTIHQILLARAAQDNPPKGKLRFIRSCSSSLAPVVLEQLESTFGAPVLEAYGMSEASHQIASNPLPPAKRKPGTVGMGTNVQIAILAEDGKVTQAAGVTGEVCLKGLNITNGYFNNPAANKANWTDDGWFKTGDQGVLDGDGYLKLTGRIKELINRGGEKISPVELDAVLLQHPAVAEAVSFAIPDEKYGEEVAAAVVIKDTFKSSSDAALKESITEHCKASLAAFKVPKRIYISTSLPKTDTGKIQR